MNELTYLHGKSQTMARHEPHNVSIRDNNFLAPSLVSQEMSVIDQRDGRKYLFEPESSFERADRLAREYERRSGIGPTSLAAARSWAAARNH